jgi:hypothetical protein
MEKSKLTETEKPRQVKSILIISSDIKGIVHKELVLAGQTVNSTYYFDVYGDFVKMCEDFTLNFGDTRTGCRIMTMQSHTSFFTREFLTKNNMTVVPTHPTHLT